MRILILCCILGAASMHAQEVPQTLATPDTPTSPWITFGARGGAAPVMLTGGYRILGQASDRTGTFSEKPPDLWRFELNPTVSLYGIPITANVLVSSEQSGVRQNINAFSLTLDPNAVKAVVTQRAYAALNDFVQTEAGQLLNDYENVKDSLAQYDPEKLKELEEYKRIQELRDVANGNIASYTDLLNKMGFMSDVEKVMVALPTVGYGTVFPTYSPLTLNGARIEGGFVEWNPGNVFYIAAAHGTTQQPLVRTDSFRIDTTFYRTQNSSDFGRSLYAGRIGIGNKDADYFLVTGVYCIDDRNSIQLIDTNRILTPQKNMNGSIAFKTSPIDGVWTLDAEVAGSLTVGDLNAPQFNTDAVPGFLLDLVESSASSYADIAYSANTQINIRSIGTRFTGSVRRIGSGYRALGVPNLRTDYFRYDLRLDQSFIKRQVNVGVFMRRDRDNLIPIKRATTSLESIGATLGLNFRGYPYLRVSYAPYVQVSDATDTLYQYRNATTLGNVTVGYSYRIGDLSANTNFTYGRQDAQTKNHQFDYKVNSLNLMQTVNFQFPLSLNMGVGHIQQDNVQAPRATIITIDGGGSYQIADFLSANLGLTIALDETYGNRTGFNIGAMAKLGEIADVDLRIERNIFNEFFNPAVLGGSYTENIFRLTISKSW